MSSSGAKAGGYPLDLTGATAPTRYVGGTTSGAPTAGTFDVGDFVIDATGKVWVCTAAGTPGTWAAAGGGAVSLTTASAVLAGGNFALATSGVNEVVSTATNVASGTWMVWATLVVSSATAGCNVQMIVGGNGVMTYNGPNTPWSTLNVANGVYTLTGATIMQCATNFTIALSAQVSAAATAYYTNTDTGDTAVTGLVGLKVA